MAREALSGYLESIFARGIRVSRPSKLKGANVHHIRPATKVAVPLMLRQMRQDAGLTQQQLAKRLGVAYTSYQRLENPRKGNMTLEMLDRVCDALGCSAEVDLKAAR